MAIQHHINMSEFDNDLLAYDILWPNDLHFKRCIHRLTLSHALKVTITTFEIDETV